MSIRFCSLDAIVFVVLGISLLPRRLRHLFPSGVECGEDRRFQTYTAHVERVTDNLLAKSFHLRFHIFLHYCIGTYDYVEDIRWSDLIPTFRPAFGFVFFDTSVRTEWLDDLIISVDWIECNNWLFVSWFFQPCSSLWHCCSSQAICCSLM